MSKPPDKRRNKDSDNYGTLHHRLQVVRGKAKQCISCQREHLAYGWANVTGNLQDPDDYIELCFSCHKLFDLGRITAKELEDDGKKQLGLFSSS